ncbi:hypothetical protein SAMN05216227_102039 [Pseudorhodobacter antarcticus]|uniref:Uncharacterized protein n=1 Tax=Pseudorhodobacter antarcticus TaxID=1077947 RepID=A0A1H8IJ62_9RHOB|nr:hypothetical protein [Pseudorhodobacter antarcticus]SEN67728.1 hypothetical protein SAMN05216227_102039 [Pseudorhodobacter antarcticus]
MKTVIQLDDKGFFTGFTTADESPLEPGVYHMPGGAVDAPNPPELSQGEQAKWDGKAWAVVPPEPEPEPEPVPEPTIAERREAMVASPAQIRVTLWQLGLIKTVQAIADADPKAAIVWEYATEIRRTNALIDALGSDGFTPEQIDDIFVYAMQVSV